MVAARSTERNPDSTMQKANERPASRVVSIADQWTNWTEGTEWMEWRGCCPLLTEQLVVVSALVDLASVLFRASARGTAETRRRRRRRRQTGDCDARLDTALVPRRLSSLTVGHLRRA